MKCSVFAAVFLLALSYNYPMENKSEGEKSKSSVVKKIVSLGKYKSNHLFLFNESEYVFVISNGKQNNIVHPNGTTKIKLRITHPLIIKTGDLTEQLTIDGHKKGVQRYKISATASAITITDWPIES